MKTNYLNLTPAQRAIYKPQIDCLRMNLRNLKNKIAKCPAGTELGILSRKVEAIEKVLNEIQYLIISQNGRNVRILWAQGVAAERGITYEAACRNLEINLDGSWIGRDA